MSTIKLILSATQVHDQAYNSMHCALHVMLTNLLTFQGRQLHPASPSEDYAYQSTTKQLPTIWFYMIKLTLACMQNLAIIAWAFAKLGYFEKALFEAFSSQAVNVAHQMADQDLAHVTWAMCHAFSAQAASEGIGEACLEVVTEAA